MFEFFIEGTRSRTGKMLKPKLGVVNIILDSFFEKKIKDAHILPVTINYSRVLEGETFPMELLGEEKVKESLSRIVKAGQILKENFGSIYIHFCEPFKLSEYIASKPHLKPATVMEDRKVLAVDLGYKIVHTLSNNLIVLPTQIVATCLLMNRKGISEDVLVTQVKWLWGILNERGAKMPYSTSPGLNTVKLGIAHLKAFLERKKDVFEPSVSPRVDYKNILMLSYYKNYIIKYFTAEAYVAVSLFGYGH
jgi:glycerol-3-phosphate O-acyltransferase